MLLYVVAMKIRWVSFICYFSGKSMMKVVVDAGLDGGAGLLVVWWVVMGVMSND